MVGEGVSTGRSLRGRRTLDAEVTWGGPTCERFSVPLLQ